MGCRRASDYSALLPATLSLSPAAVLVIQTKEIIKFHSVFTVKPHIAHSSLFEVVEGACSRMYLQYMLQYFVFLDAEQRIQV